MERRRFEDKIAHRMITVCLILSVVGVMIVSFNASNIIHIHEIAMQYECRQEEQK